MKVHGKEFFSNAQKEMIRQAVRDAEQDTTGEIAIVLVDESDRYREAEILGAILIAAFSSFVVAVALRYITIWFYVPLTLILFLPSHYLFRKYPHLKRALLTKKRIADAVRERAAYGFFQKGLHKTKEQTGILIFISLLERHVWILADQAIHGKVRNDFWRSLTRELVEGIKEHRAFEALTSVLAKCSAELKTHFPGPHRDCLPDDVSC
jgi:putative membrane protein